MQQTGASELAKTKKKEKIKLKSFMDLLDKRFNKPIFGFSTSGERGASNTDKSRNTGWRDTQRMEKAGHGR